MPKTTPPTDTTIAVIGTGNMGAPMSINLARAGFTVRTYDICEEKMLPLQEHGVIACSSHADAIEPASAILTMLPTGAEVADVVDNHVLGHAGPGALVIDSSTIDLHTSQQLHDRADSAGYVMIDAPVSGGTAGAHSGNLTFMVGGKTDALASAMGILQAMAGKIIHCGEGGMGQAAKMCNNMMLGIQMASVAEGFRLALQVGLSAQTLYDVSSNSSGNCFSLTAFNPVPGLLPDTPASRDFTPGFSTDLMLKDMKLALEAAAQGQVPLDVAPIAMSLYQAFSNGGSGDLDFSAIIRLHEQQREPE